MTVDLHPSSARAGASLPEAAFEGFFERHRRKLTFVVWLVTRDQAEAEEIAQDAFLAVWERWEDLATVEEPDGYLFRTGLNLARNRRRRTRLALKRVVHLAPPPDEASGVASDDATDRALASLSRAQRASVVLVDLLGYTSVEAGGMLRISPSTVRVHLARARASLRQTLEDHDD